MKKRIAAFAVFVFLLTSTGCSYYDHTPDPGYLDGSVKVWYTQEGVLGNQRNDHVDFVFYKEGNYRVSFSITPGGLNETNRLPADFKMTVTKEQLPLKIKVEQLFIPNFLRIVIEKDGKTEYRDFR